MTTVVDKTQKAANVAGSQQAGTQQTGVQQSNTTDAGAQGSRKFGAIKIKNIHKINLTDAQRKQYEDFRKAADSSSANTGTDSTTGGTFYDQYKRDMADAIEAYNKSIDQGLEGTKAGYDDQKEQANVALKNANRSAQGAYLQAINPYGYDSQQLAALGLQGSGVSESSRISAGNAYQNSLASAQTSYSDSVRQADLAYNQAKAQAEASKSSNLASNLQSQAEAGMTYGQWAAENDRAERQYQASLDQWAAEFGLNKQQVEASISNAAAELALKQKELEDQIATNKITRAKAEAEYKIYLAYAAKQAQADLAYTQAQTAALNRG